jgi:hypothetical protein
MIPRTRNAGCVSQPGGREGGRREGERVPVDGSLFFGTEEVVRRVHLPLCREDHGLLFRLRGGRGGPGGPPGPLVTIQRPGWGRVVTQILDAGQRGRPSDAVQHGLRRLFIPHSNDSHLLLVSVSEYTLTRLQGFSSNAQLTSYFRFARHGRESSEGIRNDAGTHWGTGATELGGNRPESGSRGGEEESGQGVGVRAV